MVSQSICTSFESCMSSESKFINVSGSLSAQMLMVKLHKSKIASGPPSSAQSFIC